MQILGPCSDNKYASSDDACAFLAKEGISIFAKKGMTDEEYFGCFEQAWRFKDKEENLVGPDFVIDDGCDTYKIFARKTSRNYFKN